MNYLFERSKASLRISFFACLLSCWSIQSVGKDDCWSQTISMLIIDRIIIKHNFYIELDPIYIIYISSQAVDDNNSLEEPKRIWTLLTLSKFFSLPPWRFYTHFCIATLCSAALCAASAYHAIEEGILSSANRWSWWCFCASCDTSCWWQMFGYWGWLATQATTFMLFWWIWMTAAIRLLLTRLGPKHLF